MHYDAHLDFVQLSIVQLHAQYIAIVCIQSSAEYVCDMRNVYFFVSVTSVSVPGAEKSYFWWSASSTVAASLAKRATPPCSFTARYGSHGDFCTV